MDRRPGTRSRLRLALMLAISGVMAISCATMRQASFALAEPGCTRDPASCAATCKTMPGGGECNVLTVLEAERIEAQGGVPGLAIPVLLGLHTRVAEVCRSGVARACAADEQLRAEADKFIGNSNAAMQASQALKAPAHVADIVGRAKAVQAAADEAVRLDGTPATAKVFQFIRSCRLPRTTCTESEAMAEQESAIGAQAGLADWLVDRTAGMSQQQAQIQGFAPDVEPALAQAETLVKAAKDAAQLLAGARAARKAELDASMAAAADCDAQGPSHCNGKCDAGEAQYCRVIGLGEWKGDPPNFSAARMLLGRACDGGAHVACEELPRLDADATRIPVQAWETVQAVGDRLAANRFTLATILQVRPTPKNVRDVATARALEPKMITDEYCPARASFVRLEGADAFRRRAAAHCKDTPPTAQGLTGAQVPLPQQCAVVYAISCPATPAPAARPLPHVVTPTCMACPAGTHGEGKMNSPACWCTTGDASKDVHMSLNISPPSPSCRPAGACATGCAFSCP